MAKLQQPWQKLHILSTSDELRHQAGRSIKEKKIEDRWGVAKVL
jgi:hypothetical protein